MTGIYEIMGCDTQTGGESLVPYLRYRPGLEYENGKVVLEYRATPIPMKFAVLSIFSVFGGV